MSSEYYTLEKTAEVLGLMTGEVTRLRERGELRAFRDGSSWKFRKVDVDNRVAQSIRERSAGTGTSDADESGGDSDMFVEAVAEQKAATDLEAIDFDDTLEVAGDELLELSLAPAPAAPPAGPSAAAAAPISLNKKGKEDELASEALQLADDDLGFDSGLSLGDSQLLVPLSEVEEDGSEFTLSQDVSSRLEAESSKAAAASSAASDSSASDSSPSDDDDDLLTFVAAEEMEMNPSSKPVAAAAPSKAAKPKPAAAPSSGTGDFDFGAFTSEDSESASQVIAVEEGGIPNFTEPSGFGTDDPFGGAASGAGGMAGGGAFDAQGFGAAASTAPTPTTVITEAEFTPMAIGLGLIPCLLLVGLCMMMMLDLIVHIWSWGQPSSFTSLILSSLGGML